MAAHVSHAESALKHGKPQEDSEASDSNDSLSDEEGDEEPTGLEAGRAQAAAGEKHRNDMQEGWSQLIKDLSVETLKATDEAQQQFFEKHEALISPAPVWALKGPWEVRIQQRNVAYKLAYDGGPELPHLMKLIVEKYPRLLEDADQAGLMAFHHAIKTKLEWFIKAVVSSEIKNEELERALGPIKNEEGQVKSKQNCIHQAITTDLEPSLTRKLVERAPNLLGAQDVAGLTPLHHAVDYKRCSKKGSRRVVETLLLHGDGALDKRTNPPDAFSVYQYHMHTRTLADLRKAPKVPTDRGDIRVDRKNDRTRPSQDKKPMPGTENEAPVLGPVMDEKKQKERRDEEKETPMRSVGLQRVLTLNMSVGLDAPAQPNESRQLSEGTPKQQTISTPTLSVPPNGSVVATKTTSSNKRSGQSSRSRRADDIAKMLKLHYFRSIFYLKPENQDAPLHSHASAERFLFGDNRECKDICFEFPPVSRKEPEKIDFERFKESYEPFAFDPMLLYVAFGKLEVQLGDDDRSVKKRLQQGRGRRDLVQFFKWLHQKKGVKNIIKVSVEEGEDVPHSDEAIVECLEDFDIEILDWRKPDVCPLAIQGKDMSLSNLRELHLYWSGNNTVLRAWSAPGGLAGLPKLTKIHIYEIKASLDSPGRIKSNLDDFKTQLNEARERLDIAGAVEVKTHRYHDLYSSAHGVQNSLSQGTMRPQGGRKIDEYQWLDIMDTFAEGIRRVQSERPNNFSADYLTSSTLPRELTRDVTVALIDDGVDFMHKAISSKLIPGRSFDSGFGSRDLFGSPAPFHGSTTGHGTFMAYLIQRVCPSVKIFVYKIDVLPKEKASDPVTFTAKSAADAVEDAVKRGFDIISMSWSVQRNDSEDEAVNNTRDLNRLKESLQKASNDLQDSRGKKLGKETLLFCSAPDIGQSSLKNSHYPFNCEGVSKIFRIGAAQATGKAYPWAGDQVGFIFPGENVGMKPTDMVRPNEDNVPKTGSSVATALAAGLAAMIIHCVRIGAVYNSHKRYRVGVSETSVRAIKTFHGMKAAFDRISDASTGKGDRRLEVETFFKGRAAELSKSPPPNPKEKDRWNDENWRIIAEIARGLLLDVTEKEFSSS